MLYQLSYWGTAPGRLNDAADERKRDLLPFQCLAIVSGMSEPKNTISRNPRIRRWKEVQKRLEAVIREGNYTGSLFETRVVRTEKDQEKWEARKSAVVREAYVLGITIPKALLDEVYVGDLGPGFDENPQVPPDKDDGPPF